MSERTSRIFSGCRSSTYIIIFLQTSSIFFFCPCHRSSGAHSSFVEDDEDEDDDACCYRSAQEKLTDVLCCCLILFHLSFISFHFTPFLVAHQRFLLTLTGCFFCVFHSSLFLTPPIHHIPNLIPKSSSAECTNTPMVRQKFHVSGVFSPVYISTTAATTGQKKHTMSLE